MLPVNLDQQTVIAQSQSHGVAVAAGVSVPSNGAKGYAPGCLFVKLSAATPKSDGVYLNTGTRTSAAFKPTTIQTEGALLIPSVDEAGRDLLPQTAGSMCWNTEGGTLDVHNGTSWEAFAPT